MCLYITIYVYICIVGGCVFEPLTALCAAFVGFAIREEEERGGGGGQANLNKINAA